MPESARLLRTIQKAVQAFQETPGRRGHLVCLQAADEALAAGDLHGNFDNFRELLLRADLARHPRRHLVLQELVHGGFRYESGGDKSHQLLDLLAALKCQFPDRVHMLLGNHELAQLTGHWIAKAAAPEDDLSQLFRRGVDTAYGPFAGQIYDAYIALLAVLPFAVRTSNRVFLSHSIPSSKRLTSFDPAILEAAEVDKKALEIGGSVYSLVWGRDTSADNVAAFLQKVDADLLITGHISCPGGYEAPNDRQIILDSLGDTAAYCLFPADRKLTHTELVGCVRLLREG